MLWLLKSQSNYEVGLRVLVLVVQTSRLVVYTRNVQVLHLHWNQFNVILLPYRYAFHLQVTSDENSATILDVGSLRYECISVIFGLARCGTLSVSLRYKQWQCSLLHISDTIDALEAVWHPMFADITVIAVLRLWIFSSDISMVCNLMCGRNWSVHHYVLYYSLIHDPH